MTNATAKPGTRNLKTELPHRMTLYWRPQRPALPSGDVTDADGDGAQRSLAQRPPNNPDGRRGQHVPTAVLSPT